jgi:hypothetical protein
MESPPRYIAELKWASWAPRRYHAGHSSLNGPPPEAVRHATHERYRNVNNAILRWYVHFQGCVSGPEKAAGVHYSKFARWRHRREDAGSPRL